MTTYTWIKLYIEILNDPKVGQMPDWLKWRMVQIFLVAREINRDGLLGPVAQLAWRLRINEDDLVGSLRTMSEIGIVAETPDGWLVVNFKKRQEAMSSADRSRQLKKRKRNDAETNRCANCNEEAADSSTSTSSSSSESLSSVLEEDRGVGEGETAANVFAAYQSNIGLLTPMIADALKEAEQTYTAEWVTAAIEEAVRSNARSMKYCEAILKRWSRDGFKAPKAANTAGSGKETPEERQAHAMENIRKGLEMAEGSDGKF